MPIRGREWERKSSAGGGERGGREKRRGSRGRREREREAGSEGDGEAQGERTRREREGGRREKQRCVRGRGKGRGPFLHSSGHEKQPSVFLFWGIFTPCPSGWRWRWICCVSGGKGTRQSSRMSESQTVIEFLPGYILPIVVNDFLLITTHPRTGRKGQCKPAGC